MPTGAPRNAPVGWQHGHPDCTARRLRLPAQVRQSVRMLFPVLPIELLDDDLARRRFQTTDVYRIAIGIGTRDIESLYPADLAEQMPGDARIERVGGKFRLTPKQLESSARYDQMQVARFGANGAVALRALDLLRRFNLEGDGSAVALARVGHCLFPSWSSS